MTWLVTGAGGLLGRALLARAEARGEPVIGLTRAQLDIAEGEAFEAVLDRVRPLAVINAAAFSQVDRAETERQAAWRANALGPARLAQACAARNIGLIHVSTEQVFDGSGDRPWRETDPTAPLNHYGRTKAEGEAAVLASGAHGLVVRTSWLFGHGAENFLAAILKAARTQPELRVVSDQIGRPTPVASLADFLLEAAGRLAQGHCPAGRLVHFAGAPAVSRLEFARAIVDAARLTSPPTISGVATADWPAAAARPLNAVLDLDRLESDWGVAAPDWRPALALLLDKGH